jgi:hypothetical protein
MVQFQPREKAHRTQSHQVVFPCHPSYTGSKNKENYGPSIRQDLVSKITKAKRVGGMAKVVEHLPSKWEALRSNPGTAKRKEINGNEI